MSLKTEIETKVWQRLENQFEIPEFTSKYYFNILMEIIKDNIPKEIKNKHY
jgi:hypothetical protein